MSNPWQADPAWRTNELWRSVGTPISSGISDFAARLAPTLVDLAHAYRPPPTDSMSELATRLAPTLVDVAHAYRPPPTDSMSELAARLAPTLVDVAHAYRPPPTDSMSNYASRLRPLVASMAHSSRSPSSMAPYASALVPTLLEAARKLTPAAAAQTAPSEVDQRHDQFQQSYDQEKTRIQEVVNQEPVPEGKVIPQDPSSADHLRNVVDAVNWALSTGDDPRYSTMSIQGRLQLAREALTNLREASDKNSQSLVLRDAERYLWGRAGVGQFGPDYGGPGVTRFFAKDIQSLHSTLKSVSLASRLDFMRTNPNRPSSAMGGSPWFDLGLEHWDQFDKHGLPLAAQPHRLTYDEATNFRAVTVRSVAEKIVDPQQRWKALLH